MRDRSHIPPVSSRPKRGPCKLDLMKSYMDSVMRLGTKESMENPRLREHVEPVLPLKKRKEVKDGNFSAMSLLSQQAEHKK